MTEGEVSGPAAKCLLCGSAQPREAIAKHLSSCLDRAAPENRRLARDVFHVEAEGVSQATGALYWLHFLARDEATLWDVDTFLRRTWLEPCCGHLSAFTMGSVRFEAYPNDEYGPPAEAMKDAPLSEVLASGKTFEHEYDFGSTTELGLRVVARRVAGMRGRAKVQLLAQNDPPSLACGSCGKAATRVCAAGCEAGEALVCRACAPEHECGQDMLTQLVNSPRTGVCGYPTEPIGGRRGTWAVAE